MTDLSILIPARNEPYLNETINSILENSQADTDIIAVLDGYWTNPGIPDHPRVTLLHYTEPVGQRQATNIAAKISTAQYVMKLDAHCAVAPGFDRILLEDIQPGWCIVPTMRNLHVFDWICTACNWRKYQGPTPDACPQCGGGVEKEMIWHPKPSPQSRSFCFDPEPHFQYFKEFNKRPEGKGDLTETMSLQGSCFMMSREMYLDLNVCDESFGSWGSQGIEVACKVWLSGGRVMVDNRTWYAHLFRTQGGDFGFPYRLSGNQVETAKARARELFFEGRWDRAIKPLSWLVEKFWPVPGWTEEDLNRLKHKPLKPELKRGVIYYTDNRLTDPLFSAVQNQLQRSVNGHEVVSVSLKPVELGRNIVLDLERGYLTMFRQILAGLEASTADIVFLAEHDVLYHPSHFEFIPPDPAKVWYNTNVWHVRASDGHAVTYTAKRTSQICAYREVLLEHYRKRVERVEREGFSYKIGFEPGSHRRKERIDDLESDTWVSAVPNLDIKHGQNLTPARWAPAQFRDRKNCQNWQEADFVPGWGTWAEIQEQIWTRIPEK